MYQDWCIGGSTENLFTEAEIDALEEFFVARRSERNSKMTPSNEAGKFTSSNGQDVQAVAGDLMVGDPALSLTPIGVEAMREYFQYEQDQKLGRWRWPEDPNYVVYADGREASVFSEVTASWGQWAEAEAKVEADFDLLARAARAYFYAHPEPKPWQTAKPGEVWVFNDVLVALKQNNYWEVRDQNGGNAIVGGDSIKNARRIWPEGD